MNSLQEKLLAEAVRIGDQLILQAVHHPVGISWLSAVVLEDTDETTLQESGNLYNGTGGIILFFLELYRKTDNPAYLETVRQALLRLEVLAETERLSPYAWLTGSMSVPFVFLRMYEVTGQTEYLDKAFLLTQPVSKYIQEDIFFEFLNGLSGTIIYLLHLHAATQSAWVLELINACTHKLLKHMQHGKQGICWDRNGTGIDGLCGFSHGAAGVGFVLLELGHYLKNDTFYRVAEQAFLYEQFYYDNEQKNWQDMRKTHFNEEGEQNFAAAYERGNLNFFTEPLFMNAWCHGAAGIGLSRVRAYELTGKNDYLRQAEIALEKTRKTDIEERITSFNLCHGHGGNAEIMLEAYRVLGDEQYIEWVQTIAKRGIEAYNALGFYVGGSKNKEEDISLFMGIAGIGYFYLRVLDPYGTPSILMPRLDKTLEDDQLSNYAALSISPTDLQKLVVEQLFPHTLRLLEIIIPDAVHEHFVHASSLKANNDIGEFWIDFVNTRMNILSADKEALVADAYGLELTKYRMTKAIRSHALLDYKAEIKLEDNLYYANADNDTFPQLELMLDPDMLLYQTQWNWQENNSNDHIQPDEYELLLVPTPPGVIWEIALTQFSYHVLACFKNRKRVSDAVKEILHQFEKIPSERINDFRDEIMAQIRESAKSGFLLDPQKHQLTAIEKVSLTHIIEEI